MREYSKEQKLCFDDILIVPQSSTVKSRRDVNLSMNIGSTTILGLPVIAAPMDTVCESDMAIAMAKNGGLGIIHRFMPFNKQLIEVKKAAGEDGILAVGAAIGAKGNVEEEALKLFAAGATCILIDTANGHSEYAIDAVRRAKKALQGLSHIMAGNVSTPEGFLRLADAGADSVRVGIGGGSVCTTRIVSGHGIPTLASVIDIKEAKEALSLDVGIIADGGIRTTGDMIKAFAAGADSVMLGSMLSGTEESPGSIYVDETGKYKTFRGMASKEANEGKDVPIAEGVATRVAFKGSVVDILQEIRGGLGSGCSYTGVSNLLEIYEESLYVKVSSLSVKESMPHARS